LQHQNHFTQQLEQQQKKKKKKKKAWNQKPSAKSVETDRL
jgi:hypothetical protein